jgi:hypothetical protein
MKRLLTSIVLIAALALDPIRAEAAYLGSVTQSGYWIELVAGAGDTTSITFMSVVRGRLEIDDMWTVTGNVPPVHRAISRAAERIILQIDTKSSTPNQLGFALIAIDTGSGATCFGGGSPTCREYVATDEARAVMDVDQ